MYGLSSIVRVVLTSITITSACGCADPQPLKLMVGSELPELTVVDSAGHTRGLKSFHPEGESLVVAFWGTWCAKCQEEVAVLNKLARAPNVTVIGVCLGEPPAAVQVRTLDLGIDYPVVIMTESEKFASMGGSSLPLVVIADGRGTIVAVEPGMTERTHSALDQHGSGTPDSLGLRSETRFHQGWSFWLLGPCLGIAFFYSLIIIHCCAHDSFTRWPRVNQRLGEVLSFVNFINFEDFRILHNLHHGWTNQPNRDPQYIRPGESWARYVICSYFRLVLFTYTDFFRQAARAGGSNRSVNDQVSSNVKWRDVIGKVCLVSGRRPHGLSYILLLNVYVSVAAVGALAWLCLGKVGLLYPLVLWLCPWAIGQLLIADFNYRTHVGLGTAQDSGYRGADTRSFYGGLWRVVNAVTLGFYYHREHHVEPRDCLMVSPNPVIRAEQIAQDNCEAKGLV